MKRILTREDISNLSRLTSHQVMVWGVVLSRLASYVSPLFADSFFGFTTPA